MGRKVNKLVAGAMRRDVYRIMSICSFATFSGPQSSLDAGVNCSPLSSNMIFSTASSPAKER